VVAHETYSEDFPVLVWSPTGALHLFWSAQQSSLGNALVYATSMDQGQNFSTPQTLISPGGAGGFGSLSALTFDPQYPGSVYMGSSFFNESNSVNELQFFRKIF